MWQSISIFLIRPWNIGLEVMWKAIWLPLGVCINLFNLVWKTKKPNKSNLLKIQTEPNNKENLFESN